MCIIVTDRDGTPVLNVKADSAVEIGLATKPAFIATYTMATDQASKLGLGKNQSIVCMYSNYQVSLEDSQTNHSWVCPPNRRNKMLRPLTSNFQFDKFVLDRANEQAATDSNIYRNRGLQHRSHSGAE